MNTKHQLNRIIIKTMKFLITSKNQTKHKTTDYTEQELEKISSRNKYIKIQQITIPLLLESPKSKDFQLSDLKIDFLVDSGAILNIINFPTWNEIQTLHPKLLPSKTSSKLATAQRSSLTNYGKIHLLLVPIRTMERNKLSNKPFKQKFHITIIKHNIVGIQFITKYIPIMNILNSKLHIKDKYSRMIKTSSQSFED